MENFFGRKVRKAWLMKPKKRAGSRCGGGEWRTHKRSAPPQQKQAKPKDDRRQGKAA